VFHTGLRPGPTTASAIQIKKINFKIMKWGKVRSSIHLGKKGVTDEMTEKTKCDYQVSVFLKHVSITENRILDITMRTDYTENTRKEAVVTAFKYSPD
jgi:hypothetical protein